MSRDTIDSEMNRGFLQLLILFLLEKATYGYGILQRVNGLGYSVEENSLYPLLRRLAEKGYLSSKWEVVENKPRKYYEISKEGRALRKQQYEVWKQQNEILSGLKEEIDHE